jgi:hypothetical protein
MVINVRRADTNDDALISELSTITFLDTFTGTCSDEDITQFVLRCFNREQVYKESRIHLIFIISLLLMIKRLAICE